MDEMKHSNNCQPNNERKMGTLHHFKPPCLATIYKLNYLTCHNHIPSLYVFAKN